MMLIEKIGDFSQVQDDNTALMTPFQEPHAEYLVKLIVNIEIHI